MNAMAGNDRNATAKSHTVDLGAALGTEGRSARQPTRSAPTLPRCALSLKGKAG